MDTNKSHVNLNSASTMNTKIESKNCELWGVNQKLEEKKKVILLVLSSGITNTNLTTQNIKVYSEYF